MQHELDKVNQHQHQSKSISKNTFKSSKSIELSYFPSIDYTDNSEAYVIDSPSLTLKVKQL